MNIKNTQNYIESLVSFLDDPNYVPINGKRTNYPNDLSVYKKCIPANLLSEIDKNTEIFNDTILSDSGFNSFSIMDYFNELPSFGNLKYVNKLDKDDVQKTGLLPGKILKHSIFADMTCLNKAIPRTINNLFSSHLYVFEQNGEYKRMPKLILDTENTSVSKAKEMSGFAFNHRYDALMEFPLINGITIAFPVNLAQIKEVLKDRDKPENGKRRSSLVHLVSQHKRETKQNLIYVREHLRGKIECKWRGWDVTLHPSRYDIERLE